MEFHVRLSKRLEGRVNRLIRHGLTDEADLNRYLRGAILHLVEDLEDLMRDLRTEGQL